VGLLGVPGASAPSAAAILPFRRSFFQPSPLGVVVAELAEAGVRARPGNRVVPQLVQETHEPECKSFPRVLYVRACVRFA